MTTRYRGLTIQQIVSQLNIDQFTRLCNKIDSINGKGTRFDVLAIRPYRDNKDKCQLSIDIVIDSFVETKTFEIYE